MTHPRLRGWTLQGTLRALAGAYLVAIAAGVVAFIVSPSPRPATDAQRADSPPRDAEGRINWASIRAGARIRASIWDYFRGHHPLFVIDGEPQPMPVEKWASLTRDRFPWLEVQLPGPRQIHEVIIKHAGWRETAGYTNDRYTIGCYREDTLVAEVAVVNNAAAVARHPLACSSADRVLIVFDCSRSVDVARIYEIEAWGREAR